jgi:AAA domain
MNQPQPVPVPDSSVLPGVKVLLIGPAGVGKTYCLGTLVESGLEVFYYGLEGGIDPLLGYWTDRGQPVPANLHWQNIQMADFSLESMVQSAETVNKLSFQSLTQMTDPFKSQYNQMVTFLRGLMDFKDQRTGRSYGAVDKWGPDKALVIDSLTAINSAALSLAAGTKPVKSPGEWGIAMDQVERLVKKLTDIRAHFIMIAHVEREVDEVLGGSKITVGTLGRKLAPKLAPMFSDVVLAVREGTKFTWSTANTLADLKARNIPYADGMPPSFKPLLDRWQSRGGRFTAQVQA